MPVNVQSVGLRLRGLCVIWKYMSSRIDCSVSLCGGELRSTELTLLIFTDHLKI